MDSDKIFGDLFLSVGAMKAGTTWLYGILERHPELHFSREKEVHYFYHKHVNPNRLNAKARMENMKSNWFVSRYNPENADIRIVRGSYQWAAHYLSDPVDDAWYDRIFSPRRPGYRCDFSNLYAHLPPEAWADIRAKTGRLRVLYVMRDPLKRLWSHVKFHMQLNNQLDVLSAMSPRELETFARQKFLWDNAEYGTVVRALQENLPPENLKIMFFEDLHADKEGTLREIYDFLGVAHHEVSQEMMDRRVNESVALPMPAAFGKLFGEDVARITQELRDLGFDIPDAWAA